LNASDASIYVTSLEEVLWGAFLVALTMAIHGVGVVVTLRASGALRRRQAGLSTFRSGIRLLVVATWLLVVVHLIEVLGWATFFRLADAFANTSTAFYYALMQYTTVSSGIQLPDRLRLLGGMIAMSGLLTFAWSTSVLLILARQFQEQASRPLEP
jgi:hypothetical protein